MKLFYKLTLIRLLVIALGICLVPKSVFADQTPFIYQYKTSDVNLWNDHNNILANDGKFATSSATTFTTSVIGINFDFSQMLPPTTSHAAIIFKINAKHKLDIFQWKNSYLYYLYNIINPNDVQLKIGLHDFGINLSAFTYPTLAPIYGSYPNATILYFTYDELGSGSANTTFVISDYCDYGWQEVCNNDTHAQIDFIQAAVQYDLGVTDSPISTLTETPNPTQTATPTPTPIPTPTSKLPVILIPGGMGSKLEINSSQIINIIQKQKKYLLRGYYVHDSGTWSYKERDLVFINENFLSRLDTKEKISYACGNFLDILKFDNKRQPLYNKVGKMVKLLIVNISMQKNI